MTKTKTEHSPSSDLSPGQAGGRLPRWPLICASVVYAGWVAFLLVMAYVRIRETTRP